MSIELNRYTFPKPEEGIENPASSSLLYDFFQLAENQTMVEGEYTTTTHQNEQNIAQKEEDTELNNKKSFAIR